MKKLAVLLSLILSHLGFSQSLPISGNQYHLYGPNSTWGEYLKVGGDGRGTTNASVVSTDGNLHLDSKDGKALYLNYYSLGNTYLNSLGGNVGIGTTSPTSQLDIRTPSNKSIRLNYNNESAVSFWPNNGNSVFHISHGHDNKLYISQGGTVGGGELMTFVNTGYVGIGTTHPDSKLDIFGNNSNSTNLILSANYENIYRWRLNTIDRGNAIDMDITASDSNDSQEAVLKLSRSSSGRPEFQLFNNAIVANNGNVGIGTIDTKGFKLGVQGKIAAEEVKVAMYNNWADFVFENNYNLPTLKEVEQHIKEKGHLKDIPSAEDVKENGIFLGEMDSKLLQKIEELTLYTIDQEKRIESLEAKNEKLIGLLEELLNKKN